MTDPNGLDPFESQPEPSLVPSAEPPFARITQPKKCPAHLGTLWVKESFRFFKQSPSVWIVIAVLFGFACVLLSFGPLALLGNILEPLLMAGLLLVCRSQEETGSAKMSDLIPVFKPPVVLRLLLVGLSYLGICILLVFLIITTLSYSLPMAVIIGALSFVAITMGIYYAPALIVFNKLCVFEAVKLSFRGCWGNLSALTVWYLWMVLFTMLAILPLFLGFLVVCPMFIIGKYLSYKAVFTDKN